MRSNEEFWYPAFDENGVMPLTNTTDLYSNMLMNITVHRLPKDEDLFLYEEDEEMAVLLIEGSIGFSWNDSKSYTEGNRSNCIDYPGFCWHVPRKSPIHIINWGEETCEILVQSTKNGKDFEPKFYTPETTRRDTFGLGQFEGKAQRTVSTFFDYGSAPYSNMVCGEILIPQGGWSSYPPHEHPQPEVYYYRFGHPNGFGACFLDDNVYKITDRSFAAVPGGKYHPQVNAPGYPMMYVWMIRHFDGYPWTERNFQPEHTWLLEG